jgi:hypothetical protein
MADGSDHQGSGLAGSSWVDKVWRTTVKVNLRHVPLNFHVNLTLDPAATVYTENAKNYDYLFVPYHTSFAFRSDINRYRKNSQPIVPSLAGNDQLDCGPVLQSLHCRWHDRRSTNALTYLGYPVYHVQPQLDLFLDKMYEKIQRHARLLSTANLSILDRSLTANTLLLSRLWHVVRVTIVPNMYLKRY